MAKFEGRGTCDHCGAQVDVYSNRSGLGYYNCGPCRFRGQHMSRRTSDAFIKAIDRHAEPDDGAPPAPPAAAPAGAPPKPAPASPAPAAAPRNPEKSGKKQGGILSNFSLI